MSPVTAVNEMSLADVFKFQNQIIRNGEANESRGTPGYRVIGRLMELRHELPKDGNAPGSDAGLIKSTPLQMERARKALDKTGLVLDWRHYHKGPMLAVYPARSPQTLLIIGKVEPLPAIVDPLWRETQQVKMDYGEILASQLSAKEIADRGINLEERPMIEQDFMDHANGRLPQSATIVIGPLTQALYKIEGLQGMTLIDFGSDIYNGTSPMFFLNLDSGEGHFHGGNFRMK